MMAQLDRRFNLLELMVCVAARQLEDGKTARNVSMVFGHRIGEFSVYGLGI
jgi:hypothetical protein